MQSRLLVALFVAAISAAVVVVPRPAQALVTDDGEFIAAAFPLPSGNVSFWDSWGAKRPGGRRHRGTDVMGAKGTPVVAVADGIVILKKWHDLAGWYLGIEHADGWESYYGHLNNDTPGTDDGRGDETLAFAPGIEVGTVVEAGDLIGYVGDSGNAEDTASHTHFSLRHDGTLVNPYPFLEEAWHRELMKDEWQRQVAEDPRELIDNPWELEGYPWELIVDATPDSVR